jgi:hypothetical protein
MKPWRVQYMLVFGIYLMRREGGCDRSMGWEWGGGWRLRRDAEVGLWIPRDMAESFHPAQARSRSVPIFRAGKLVDTIAR